MKKISLLLLPLLCASPLFGQLTVYQLASSPTTDGTIGAGEWTGTDSATINNFQIGASGATGTVQLAWDATNLYALYQVTDSSRGEDSADGIPTVLNSFNDDSVELNFGRSPFTGDLNDTDNFQYRMNPGANQELETFRTGTSTGVVWAANGATNYTIEMEIPWSTLGVVTPTIGNQFSFNAVINDDDASPNDGARDAQAFWMAIDANAFQDETQWGTITLAGAIPEPSTYAMIFGLVGLASVAFVKRRKAASAA